MKTYLITGGAGFIGTNLSEQLVADGHRVIVVDDLSAGKRDRLPQAVEFHQLDICATDELEKVLQGVDVVVHLAAIPRVQTSIEKPFETFQVNVIGTLSVLESARKAGVKRIVYAASSSAYGDQETLPLKETLPPQPKHPYGLQKYNGEVLMRIWHEIYGLETVSLRFFNVYGPHLDPDGAYALVIGKFLKQKSLGEPLTIVGDGEQTRDFTHVRDTVDAIVRASVSEKVGAGEVLNVGAGNSVTVNTLAELIGGPVTHVPERVEAKHSFADNTLIRTLLEWKPRVTLEEGVTELKKEFGIV